VNWPGKTQAGVYYTPNVLATGPGGPYTWFGTLADNGGGSSGMLYRRNRYFDPVSGRFTQQDPIGVAGGMNLYGFAEGDPVNFSDPFGLCPPCAGLSSGIPAILSQALSSPFRLTNREKEAMVDALATGVTGPAGRAGSLFRFGKQAETVEKLASDAARAEARGFGHGVSVTTRRPTRTPASEASREAVEEHFTVRRTGEKPGHHTVDLPKPVTQQVADLFNRLFNRPQ
jgi:RHS repeat-associated protein